MDFYIALVQKHRIPYHEKTLGQLFCDGSAREIITMLLDECRMAGVEIFTDTTVSEVRQAEHFEVDTDGSEFHADSLVVATGGLSISKIGATAFGYDMARQFEINVRECPARSRPSHMEGFRTTFSATVASQAFLDGSHCVSRANAIPREDAPDPSRPERSGNSADVRPTGNRVNPLLLDLATWTRSIHSASQARLQSRCESGGNRSPQRSAWPVSGALA